MLLKSYIIDRYLESPKPQKPWKKQKKVLGMPGKPKSQKNKTLRSMFGFESKGVFLFSLVFFASKANNQKTPWVFVFFCIYTINIYQPRSQKQKKLKIWFGFWDFSMQKTKPKTLKNQKNTLTFFFGFFWDLGWSYPFKKKQKHKFFCFSLSKPTKT